jgi:hypothetical protein
MKLAFLRLLLLSVIVAPVGMARAAGPATRPAPLALADITGMLRRPLELGDAKAAVVIFISVDCPISNGYAPEISRICGEYEPKGVAFYLVHADRELTDAAAKKHAADYGFTCPVLIDRKHELVRRVGATVTPEAVVIGTGGEVRYRGRIDDLYIALGKRQFDTTTHDLRNALDAVVAGKPVAVPRTAAVGCTISD